MEQVVTEVGTLGAFVGMVVAAVAGALAGVQWGRKNPSKAEEAAAKFRTMEDQLKAALEQLKAKVDK